MVRLLLVLLLVKMILWIDSTSSYIHNDTLAAPDRQASRLLIRNHQELRIEGVESE